ncbi:hypothetical protein [Luteimonas saliphila]|uniref:hypothetical protein n=1 Tax=Luteimonas saliphila TaxID=2804919 RepID=UPI00192E27E2|nr:hypothetical protein [Luteimonas saliphila]
MPRFPFLATAVIALALSAVPTASAAGPDAFDQRARVANYAVRGEEFPGAGYEALRLWADEAGGTRVRYAWGADARELSLEVLGPAATGEGFALRFRNGLVLDVVPQGDSLRVRSRDGRYDKVFDWQYEGPVDGRGTFCTPCVDQPDAAAFVRRHFIER